VMLAREEPVPPPQAFTFSSIPALAPLSMDLRSNWQENTPVVLGRRSWLYCRLTIPASVSTALAAAPPSSFLAQPAVYAAVPFAMLYLHSAPTDRSAFIL
jgi:hypothetical protein